jgi:uncharacterized protein
MVRAKAQQFKQPVMDENSRELKFAADRMLGRLVKWLRVIGQDVIYGPHLTGYGLIRAARHDNRLILTRDRGLKKKQPPEFIFIKSDHYTDQLLQVIEACRLKPLKKLFTRCLACNATLQQRAKDSVKAMVPPYVFSTQERFFWCPECRRVYWPATHHEKILEQLTKLGLC